MSQTSSGAGGSAAPGWYTDPHDPRQLRWWSGDGWTEHVSPQAQPAAQAQPDANQLAAQQAAAAAAQQQAQQAADAAAQQAAAQQAAAQQAATQQAAAQQAAAQQAATQQAAAQQAAAQQAAAQQAAAPQFGQPAPGQPAESLPSRRALRDPATEAAEAAEAALYGQQAQQQQDRPLTFLEKQGYPATPGGTAGPSAPSAPAAPAQPNAWNQPVQQAEQPAQSPQLVEPAQTPAPAAAQPAQPNAWNQPVQDAAPAAQGWAQPAQPAANPAAPALTPAEQLFAQADAAQQNLAAQQNFGGQQGYGLPSSAQPVYGQQPAAAPAASDGLDSLFGGQPAADAAPAYAQQGGAATGSAWGLTPSGRPGEEATTRTRGSESRAAKSQAEGSGTVWSWLIAASPVIAALAIGYVLKTVGSTFAWQLEAAVAAPYILVILFAIADRSALVRLGIEGAATWAFAVLTAPIYLLVRASVTRRETGTGNGPLIGWFVAVIIAALAFVGYGLLTHTALYPGLPV